MFGLIFSLAVTIPNVYVFLRLRKLFINKGYRVYYLLLYLMFIGIYLFISSYPNGYKGFLTGILTPIARYILAYYLYLFLSVLMIDILLLVNRYTNTLSLERIKSTKYKVYGMTVTLLIPFFVLVAGIINFKTIRISEYQIDIPRKSAKIDHLKIAFAADFHLRRATDIHFVERFKEKIAAIDPDILLLGGDILEGNRQENILIRYEKMFREIDTRYGIFAVLGNHDYKSRLSKGEFFDLAGIEVLSDSIAVVDNSFNLAGRIDSKYPRKSSSDLLKSAVDSLPVILLDHRPTELELASKSAVDIQFSGHTHNGQLFPINFIIKSMYTLSWGYKKISNTHFFVTSGIMLWGPPVRTTGKSEIVVVNVAFK
jgi:predicted MPP superfamily phosphohydrolase